MWLARREKRVQADTPPAFSGIPHNSDWVWQPEIIAGPLPVSSTAAAPTGTRLGSELALFHDCRALKVSLRQTKGDTLGTDGTYGIEVITRQFEGTFISLALDLPDAALRGLSKNHVFRVEGSAYLAALRPLFLRLNIMHGPNTAHFVRNTVVENGIFRASFDLASADINPLRATNAWLDLIVERPGDNVISLQALNLARFPRADF